MHPNERDPNCDRPGASESSDSNPILSASLIDPLLISNFVHQIINPLNGVLGTLDNVIDGTVKDPARKQQKLVSVRAQLVHAIELIRNLAFLSSLSPDGEDELKGKAATVVLPELIIQAAGFFQEAATSKKMHIRLLDDKTQYCVRGHEHLLRQVFINLFDNAVKYGEPGTDILIGTRIQKSTGDLLIEVENSGYGFEPNEQESIFTLGYRSAKAKQVRASGTGLGLYICRRVLSVAHNATIVAECSPAAKKTKFTIRFKTHSIGDSYVKR